MCGLVAMHTASKFGFFQSDIKQMKNLMVLNSLRGAHSTGLCGFFEENKYDYIKGVGSPYALDDYSQTETFYSKMLQRHHTVIGHGRYATQGQVNAENQHPFIEGHIVLVHNGVIRNYNELRDPKKHKDIEVDSHLIARLFAEDGAKETLPKIEGAYCFIWWDMKEETLNIARNSERPLAMGKVKNGKTLHFASEIQSLEWNESRNNRPYDSIENIKIGKIYTFPKHSIEYTTEDFDILPKYTTPNKYGYGGTSFYGSDFSAPPYSIAEEVEFRLEKYINTTYGTGKVPVSYTIDNVRVYFSIGNLDLEVGKWYTGIVQACWMNRYNDKKEWSIRVHDIVKVVESSDIQFQHIDDYTVTMSSHRLEELVPCKCGWCQSDITEQHIRDHAKGKMVMGLQAGNDGKDEFICGECIAAVGGMESLTNGLKTSSQKGQH